MVELTWDDIEDGAGGCWNKHHRPIISESECRGSIQSFSSPRTRLSGPIFRPSSPLPSQKGCKDKRMVPARASIQRSLICSATSAGVRRIAAPAFVRGATTAQSRAQHSSSRRSAQAAVAPVPQGSAPISSSANTLRVPQSDISLTLHKDSVALHAPSLGLKEPFHFDHVWLRDACQEAESVHPSTKQKLFHTSDVALVEDGKTLLDRCVQERYRGS